MKREKERSKRKRLSPFSFLEQPGGSISAPILLVLVSLLLPLHPWHGIMGGGCHPSSKTQGEDRRLLSFHNPLMASAREREGCAMLTDVRMKEGNSNSKSRRRVFYRVIDGTSSFPSAAALRLTTDP